MTTLSVSVAEEEIRGIGADILEGHLAPGTIINLPIPGEQDFVDKYKAKYGADRVTADPIEAGYTAVYLWKAAVEKAGTTEVAKVKEAAKGIEFAAPEGKVTIDGENQHIHKTVRIGEVQADGQFKELWNSGEPVKPDPYLKTYDWAKGLSGE